MQAYLWDLQALGYFSDALEIAERLIVLEPLAPAWYWRKCGLLLALQRREEALGVCQLSADLGGVDVLGLLGTNYLLHHEDTEAIAVLERLHELTGQDPSRVRPFRNNFV